MAERHTAMTPAREEHRLGRTVRPWGGSPFTALQRLADEMDRMVEDFGFGRRWGRSLGFEEGRMGRWAPEVEVFQRNNELVVRADLPGLKRDEVTVEVSDDTLKVTGERTPAEEDGGRTFRHRGRLEPRFELPPSDKLILASARESR